MYGLKIPRFQEALGATHYANTFNFDRKWSTTTACGWSPRGWSFGREKERDLRYASSKPEGRHSLFSILGTDRNVTGQGGARKMWDHGHRPHFSPALRKASMILSFCA
jgi:hypothetical protein